MRMREDGVAGCGVASSAGVVGCPGAEREKERERRRKRGRLVGDALRELPVARSRDYPSLIVPWRNVGHRVLRRFAPTTAVTFSV